MFTILTMILITTLLAPTSYWSWSWTSRRPGIIPLTECIQPIQFRRRTMEDYKLNPDHHQQNNCNSYPTKYSRPFLVFFRAKNISRPRIEF